MGDGRWQSMASTTFRVRKLPDPLPYLEIADASGNPQKYKGGRILKSNLTAAREVKAALDDDLLDIRYTVLRFETLIFDSFGNVSPEVSDGPRFSPRQQEAIRGLRKGKTFLIRGIVAHGPDGVDRTLPPMEVIVN